MVKLNHTTLVNNKPVTPFLVDGVNVYCFNKNKQTIILPLTSFKTKKAKKVPIIPASKPKTQPTLIKEKIIIKTITGGFIRIIGSANYNFIKNKKVIASVKDLKESKIFKYNPSGFIKIIGLGNNRYTVIKKESEFVPPPVIDNSRYVGRPSLSDDYI